MSAQTRVCVCADCHRTRAHKGRGLCSTCWLRNYVNGTLDRFPRLTRPHHELIEDWEELHAQGYSRRDAAARLGVTFKALEKAIQRECAARREVA